MCLCERARLCITQSHEETERQTERQKETERDVCACVGGGGGVELGCVLRSPTDRTRYG